MTTPSTPAKGNGNKSTTPSPSQVRLPTSPSSSTIGSKGKSKDDMASDEMMETFLAGTEGLEAAHVKLLEELYLANGQDAFDAEAAAVGRLKQEEYLALPTGWATPRVSPVDVGRGHVRDLFKVKDLAAIYKMNKDRAPQGENAVSYAMLRMEAVKMGWVDGQKEVIHLPFTEHQAALRELATDLAAVRTQLDTFRSAAFLIPLVCEHTFRTMGHHYITGQATDYQSRYRKTLKSCLAEDLMNVLQPANLFHHVLHWVSPARAFSVLQAQLETRTLPDALVIRASAPPAGWALVTTTAAVLQAMTSANVYDEIYDAFEEDLNKVFETSSKIKADVRKWHKAYFAYGVSGPTPKEMEDLEETRNIAIAFAPYAQGFIDATLRDAALGQAQALKKHAELNPIARSRAARFFRAMSRQEVRSAKDLFKTTTQAGGNADDE